MKAVEKMEEQQHSPFTLPTMPTEYSIPQLLAQPPAPNFSCSHSQGQIALQSKDASIQHRVMFLFSPPLPSSCCTWDRWGVGSPSWLKAELARSQSRMPKTPPAFVSPHNFPMMG